MGFVTPAKRRGSRRALVGRARGRSDVVRSIVATMSEFNNESVAAIETTLNNVDRVLERLRVGTYRTCQVCHTPIDEADLIDSPLLANCPAHPELA